MREWKHRPDYKPLVIKACKLYPTLLKHVKPDRLFLCSFTAQDSRHVAKIRSVRQPFALALPDVDYIIEFWQQRFDTASEAYCLYVVVHELTHIAQGGFNPEHENYRKLVDHDLQDFVWLRRMYGLSLERVGDVLKGEKMLMQKPKDGHLRFPREDKLD